MKCLITGVGGFVGSNLAERFIREGNRVYGLDNFQTGHKDNIPEGVRNFGNEKIDMIYHLGVPSTSPLYKADRRNIVSAINRTVQMFELAIKNKCPVVWASSSSIYSGHNPPHQEWMPANNLDWYTEVRYFMERLAYRYWEAHGVPSIGLRIFSCYGDKDVGKKQYANVITQFALDMIRGKRPLVYGDGTQKRDFIHVDDVVRGFIRASEICEKGADIINLGTGHTYSFNEAIEMINVVLETDIKPKYTKNQIHNYVFTTKADVTKMYNIMGFRGEELPRRFPEYIKKLKEDEQK